MKTAKMSEEERKCLIELIAKADDRQLNSVVLYVEGFLRARGYGRLHDWGAIEVGRFLEDCVKRDGLYVEIIEAIGKFSKWTGGDSK